MLCVIDDATELYLFTSIQNVDIKFSSKEMCTPTCHQSAYWTKISGQCPNHYLLQTPVSVSSVVGCGSCL